MELNIHILIVDDDTTFGPALEKTFKSAGYTAKWVGSSEEALQAIRLTQFQAFIVDCLLPKMNGLDLIQKLRSDGEVSTPVVLVSGIYRDSRFQSDAMQKTKALKFFSKPFASESLVTLFNDHFEVQDSNDMPLMDSLSIPAITAPQVAEILNKTDAIHGFHLPLVLSLISQVRLSGQLQLTSAEDVDAIISFNRGAIHRVVSQDFESYFGVLLVEKGFTSPQEVEAGLALNLNKPIGERLVDINSLSPHAIRVVHIEQMGIRISKLVQDTSYSLKFIPKNQTSTSTNIELKALPELWSELILSKLDDSWLKAQFISCLEYPLKIGPNHKDLKSVIGLSIFENTPHIFKFIESLESPQNLLENTKDSEEATLKSLYFLLVQKIFVLSRNRVKVQDFKGRTRRLEKILKDMEDKNHFEILGVSKKSRQSEIDKAYYEYVKVSHPDKIEPDAPDSLRQLLGNLFARVNESYQAIKNKDNRAQYLIQLEHGRAEKILETENLFEQSRDLLFRGKFSEALGILKNLKQDGFQRSDFELYYSWALLKKGTSYDKYENFIKDINYNISKIPTEERHNSTYFFVRALIYRQTGQLHKTKDFLKKALALNPSFLPAKMEATDLMRAAKKQKSSLKGDLDNLFGNMFKKKSS